MSLDQLDPNIIPKKQIADLIDFVEDMDKISKKIDKNISEFDLIMNGYGKEPDDELKPYYNKLVWMNAFMKILLGDIKVYTFGNLKKYEE